MPEDKKEFIEEDQQLMQLIAEGVHNHEFSLLGNDFKIHILQQEGTLEVTKATNGFDAMVKFPIMKSETVARCLDQVNGRELPSLTESRKFLNKLPDIVVDAIYMEYEAQKTLRDQKIKELIVNLKNSSRSQAQEGTGSGQSNSDLPGSKSSTTNQ